ncbi:hypothetical protein BRCON_0532 [Candidatus Sumerlaea chitinivorans]|uniref:Uncharacterized protein n=1 Tax=Sumerlaea chitinivorans TaxID=2250252 RepID=A0A2Z4Y2V9_SUMC1|nr:hypothetical protein BRCON_0532 [Candidatus Sumerlaea chitinivorans]
MLTEQLPRTCNFYPEKYGNQVSTGSIGSAQRTLGKCLWKAAHK